MKLGQLQVDEIGVIKKISIKGRQKERLLSLGFIKNSPIKMIKHGLRNKISMYEVYNTLIALRREDAELIEVEIL
ncbi:MAG: ferrous iron transport protein A [Bacilli bacterium]|nr:ferrous iron transport protein A [Bacilli bacterium]MDD4076462.1 FeoA family protein [Bacilli bacterium]MDD4388257.1 FeoA family protein [Bacilli bacterium]